LCALSVTDSRLLSSVGDASLEKKRPTCGRNLSSPLSPARPQRYHMCSQSGERKTLYDRVGVRPCSAVRMRGILVCVHPAVSVRSCRRMCVGGLCCVALCDRLGPPPVFPAVKKVKCCVVCRVELWTVTVVCALEIGQKHTQKRERSVAHTGQYGSTVTVRSAVKVKTAKTYIGGASSACNVRAWSPLLALFELNVGRDGVRAQL
jgi:hypothetical protein